MDLIPKETPKILLLATSSYAGLGPYVASIINTVINHDCIRFFVVEREDAYYSRNINKNSIRKGIILKESTPSKFEEALNLLTGCRYTYSDKIIEYCKKENINMVHALTSLTDTRLVKLLSSKYNLLYTIHDLIPHEAKKAFHKKMRQNIRYSKVFSAISHSKYLFTNSLSQLSSQTKKFPDKKSYYAPFPSLVTEEMAHGSLIPPELINENNYILFFGRIEEYKGLSVLVDAFEKSDISSQVKLVIAGKGGFDIKNSENIIFINRYIKEDEIACLYRNAAIVVYPYSSATQSGVLSVAAYFKTPIIASDVPFFKEVLGNDYIGIFENKNADALASKIEFFYNNSKDIKRQTFEHLKDIYTSNYDLDTLNYKLLEIYRNILGDDYYIP